MKFIVSREFMRTQRSVREKGEHYFGLMPPWVKDATVCNAVVVIAYSYEGVEKTLGQARIRRDKNVFEFIFLENATAGYQDFFGWLLRQVILNDRVLSGLFMEHVRSIIVPGMSNDDVMKTFFRHLAWYFMDPDTLRGWSQERFELCKNVDDALKSVSLPHGALQ